MGLTWIGAWRGAVGAWVGDVGMMWWGWENTVLYYLDWWDWAWALGEVRIGGGGDGEEGFGAREGVIIECPLKWQFHDLVTIILTSRTAIRRVVENVDNVGKNIVEKP